MSAPASFKSEFLQTLQARGYIHQITHPDELDAAAAGGIVTAYIGFDATAPPARRQPDPDHDAAPPAAGRPQADRPDGRRHHQGRRPTGKDESRKLLSDADIAANIAGIKRCSPSS
jgi:tyrosyl-tRNA synthetase